MTTRKVMVFIFILLLGFNFADHQAKADFDCLTLTPSSSQSDKDYCKVQLDQIEAQLANLLVLQQQQQKQTGTLKGDVDYLDSQIAALKTKIQARSLAIAQLKVDITEKANTIQTLSEQIDAEHQSLSQLLRNTNEFDNQNQNVVGLVLSDSSISDFYSDLESYSSINQAIKQSVDLIQNTQTQTEAAKTDLETQQNSETDAQAELQAAQAKVVQSEADKQQLLNVSKQTEAAYELLAAQKKAQADKIRSALFNLAGVSSKIDFGTALGYANVVQAKTGIDPAFLLAILTQESNLGANVGQCYLASPDTGAGIGKNTGTVFANVMSPTRDVPPFLAITKSLGLDPFHTAVSCPIAGVVGYGGAMGPAQFIASTWQLFEGRLQSILGYSPNPWAPQDAFMASGLYLTDLGAIGTSQSAQNKAACSYYGAGGQNCYYAQSVETLKLKIQSDIDYLLQYGVAKQ